MVKSTPQPKAYLPMQHEDHDAEGNEVPVLLLCTRCNVVLGSILDSVGHNQQAREIFYSDVQSPPEGL